MMRRAAVAGFRPLRSSLSLRFGENSSPHGKSPRSIQTISRSQLLVCFRHLGLLGTKLNIIVHFGKNVDAVELLDTANLIDLRKAIKVVFPENLAERNASTMIVRTEDAAGEFRLLENHTSKLADALGENGKFEVYVELPVQAHRSARDREKLEWTPALAKFTVDQLPLPPLETKPKFIAPTGWLERVVAAVREEYINADTDERRTQPLCVTRCSRGGKTRALKELAHRLHEASIPVIFVSFNNYSNLNEVSYEQDDPLQALLIRIAFVATHAVADRTETKFTVFRVKYHVSVENILAWLGEAPCVLIIDEMNRAKKLEKKCEEGTDFVTFLRSEFLAPSGRTFVFSSHVVTTARKLNDYLEADASRRDVLVEQLPKITSPCYRPSACSKH